VPEGYSLANGYNYRFSYVFRKRELLLILYWIQQTQLSWITSKNKGTQTTSSDTYKFYLAGDGEENAAPFSAEAIAPQPGSSVTASENNTVSIEWEAADPDSFTLTYTLHIDTVDGRQEPTEENTGLSTNTKEGAVESGTIYHWSVTTSDGSISVTSDVFSFRVD